MYFIKLNIECKGKFYTKLHATCISDNAPLIAVLRHARDLVTQI